MQPTVFEATQGLLQLAREACEAYERQDLLKRIRTAEERIGRPETVVCIVGEFKQGKSALVNGMLGSQVCPVDDDIATSAVTVLRYAESPTVKVRRREAREVIEEVIDPPNLPHYATESGNPDNQKHVEIVEVGIPNALLSRGLSLVDTPGVGGLNSGHIAATLAFLPTADALLFVSDASAELSEPEIAFLEQATKICPTFLFALTKIDLYPEWRRIAELDLQHLQNRGINVTLSPVSSVLRDAAFAQQDATLNQESGFPGLLDSLKVNVLDRAENNAARHALHDVRSVIGQMRGSFETELRALQAPGDAPQTVDDLNALRDRVAGLRTAGARWMTRMNDGFADLSSRVDYEFRSAMRTTLRDVEAELEESEPAEAWPEISRRMQDDVAAAVADVFQHLNDGTEEVRDTIVDLLQEQELGFADGSVRADTFDTRSLWTDRDVTAPTTGSRIGTGFNTLRGAQGGVLVLGMLGNLMGFAIMGPALIGIAVVFGGKQLIDERKRLLQQRRQQARTFVRQFIDDVQFEVGTRIRDMTRDLQRQLRDHFNDRISELLSTLSETTRALESSMQQDMQSRNARIDVLQRRMEKLDIVLERVGAVEREA